MLLAPIVEIFCDIDDFCKHHQPNTPLKLLEVDGVKRRNRRTQMSMSEIMTVLVLFHLSHYRGYIDKKLTERLAEYGLKLITKVRKNMKKKVLTAFEKFFLYQRSIVETVIDQLKSICHIEHS